MTITALYFISDTQNPQSSPTYHAIHDRLLKTFDPRPIDRWRLDHRLFRSVRPSNEDKSPPRYQHVLSLDHKQGNAHIVISDPADPQNKDRNAAVTVPAHQLESYGALLVSKLSALWEDRQRLQVQNGVTYEVEEVIVRIGEVRQVSGQSGVRGVVVCIEANPRRNAGEIDATDGVGNEVNGKDVDDEDTENTRSMIRALWKSFGVEGAKEIMNDGDAEGMEDTYGDVKMWCNTLRLRP